MRKYYTLLLYSLLINGLFAQDSVQLNIDTFAWSIDIEDVVVTAQYAPTDSRNVVYPVRQIDRATIEQRGVNNLEQLLNQELNIRISQDLILGSSIRLQGISGQNVKIMIDGVPVIGMVGDDIDLSQIQLDNIERVEIVEGPLSVNYGTNALGGAINLITKKSQLNTVNAEVRAQVESTNRWSTSGLLGIRLWPRLLLQFNGSLKEQKGFNTIDTIATRSYEWNPKKQWSAGSMLRWQRKETQDWVYTFNHFEEKIDNLGAIRRPEFKPYAFDDYYQTMRQDHSIQYKGEWADKYYVNTTVAYNLFKREKNSYRYNFEEKEEIKLGEDAQDTTRFNAFVFRPVFAKQNRSTAFNYELGIDFNYENGYGEKIVDTLSSNEHFTYLVDAALFGILKYQPSAKLTMQLGARAAYNSRYNAPVVPSVNVLYHFSSALSLRLAYAKGFRSPSLKELFYYFVDTNHFIIGNKDLEAETSHNIQAVLDWKKKWREQQYHVSVGTYYNAIKNKIGLYDFVEVDGKLVPAASVGQSSTQYAYFNQSVYRSIGANMRVEWEYKRWQLSLGFAPIGQYNPVSEIDESVSAFTFSYETNSMLSYSIPKWKWQTTLFLRGNDKLIRYYQDYDDNEELITKQSIQDGYQLLDWSMQKALWKNRINLTVGVQNIMDVTRVNISNSSGGAHSGGSGNVPIGVGRNYFMRMVYKF